MDKVLGKRVVDFLNEVHAIDASVLPLMISRRVACNDALGDHPTCQVNVTRHGCEIGLLGLLNGLVGVYEDGPKKDWGCIAAEYNDEHQLTGFRLLENVEDLKPEISESPETKPEEIQSENVPVAPQSQPPKQQPDQKNSGGGKKR